MDVSFHLPLSHLAGSLAKATCNICCSCLEEATDDRVNVDVTGLVAVANSIVLVSSPPICSIIQLYQGTCRVGDTACTTAWHAVEHTSACSGAGSMELVSMAFELPCGWSKGCDYAVEHLNYLTS